jgi:hypothetical protein
MDTAREIDGLLIRVCRGFDAGHDFCAHTSIVWQTFHTWVGRGNTLSETNAVTGTSVTEQDLVNLAGP